MKKLIVPLSILAVLAGATACLGQSDTGRSRAPQKVRPQPEKTAEELTPASKQQWRFAFQVGMAGSGRAFQVENASGLAVPWDLGSGSSFQASRFNATFDQNLGLGLDLSRDLGKYWGVCGGISYARLDLGAEALAGQQGLTILLDRVDFFQLGLGLTTRLVAQENHPYASAEAVFCSLGHARMTDLDQSALGWRLGLGYRHGFSEKWTGRIQGRLSRMSYSTGDFSPEVSVLDPPEILVESEDHLTFFEIMLGIEFH